MSGIFVTSSINRARIRVGESSILKGMARFDITENRFFHAACGFGIDQGVGDRKEVSYCKMFRFVFWPGRPENCPAVIDIPRQIFMGNAWLYPRSGDPDYKANPVVFKPKVFLTVQKALELTKPKELTEDEKTQQFCKENY